MDLLGPKFMDILKSTLNYSNDLQKVRNMLRRMVWLIIVQARFNLKELDSKMRIGIIMKKPTLKEHHITEQLMLISTMDLT